VLERASWRALGTSVTLLVLDGNLSAARQAVESLLDTVDATYSRFRDDSELSRLNAGAREATPISPLMATALEAALRSARDTDGAVDPTIGRQMRLIGYDDDFSVIDGRRNPEIRLESVPGWRVVRFSSVSRSVQIPRGVELDLGSIGKALAADLAAEAALASAPGGGVLVSFGGDIALGGRAPDGGWRVLAAEDSETPPDAPGEVISLDHGALATSSTTVRRWRTAEGNEVHHIIDPRTGGPTAGPWRTVTVAAETCVAANTAATATIVLGEKGLSWLESRVLPSRLVDVDGGIVRIGGWPEPEVSPGT
jgi:FAD:protein FMN transferase